MIVVTILALVLHNHILPFKDSLANTAFTCSLLSTLLIGLINFLRATLSESLTPLESVPNT